jgi:hypothetical protein
VARNAPEPTQTTVLQPAQPSRTRRVTEEEEQILRRALKYLVFRHGHLLVPTGIREETDRRTRRWIITVTLRYPTGFEGEIGELLYDGREFTFPDPTRGPESAGAPNRRGFRPQPKTDPAIVGVTPTWARAAPPPLLETRRESLLHF